MSRTGERLLRWERAAPMGPRGPLGANVGATGRAVNVRFGTGPLMSASLEVARGSRVLGCSESRSIVPKDEVVERRLDLTGGAVPTGAREITLRFLAAPTDAGYSGNVTGGRVLEWIDRGGYACAVGWSGSYCVTAYVGNVKFGRPVTVGDLV